MQIAIIGAGVAGLACARGLRTAGHEVTVFERSDAPGGRVATMRTEVGGFDHGAQYLTARHPAFAAKAARWERDGVIADWNVAARSLDADGSTSTPRPSSRGDAPAQTRRWVGVPGMNAVPAAMADGLDIRYGAAIVRIDPVGDGRGASPRWSLQRRDEGGDVVAVTEGLYDVVIGAVPPQVAALLVGAVPALAAEARNAHVEPCWALMIGFAEPVDADGGLGDAAFVASGRLAWIAREGSKPGRRIGERWTVHAQSSWSVEHFDDDPEDVKAKLLKAFHEATRTVEQPVYAHVHRWRHALARASLSADFLWDASRRVGLCGDWCRGYRVEDAWLSGTALANRIGDGSA